MGWYILLVFDSEVHSHSTAVTAKERIYLIKTNQVSN